MSVSLQFYVAAILDFKSKIGSWEAGTEIENLRGRLR